eukprot:3482187-Prymnesium_polylepis.1
MPIAVWSRAGAHVRQHNTRGIRHTQSSAQRHPALMCTTIRIRAPRSPPPARVKAPRARRKVRTQRSAQGAPMAAAITCAPAR